MIIYKDMPENISVPINQLKTRAQSALVNISAPDTEPDALKRWVRDITDGPPRFTPLEGPQITGNDISFPDGRKYSIHVPDIKNPNSTRMNFDFNSGELKAAGSHRHEQQGKGRQVSGIRVDIQTDAEGNMRDLNPIDINGKSTSPYKGTEVDVYLGGKKYQVRYASIDNQPGQVVLESVIDNSGRHITDLGEIGDLKDLLKVPEKIDMFATVMNLVSTDGDINTLRQNPFVQSTPKVPQPNSTPV